MEYSLSTTPPNRPWLFSGTCSCSSGAASPAMTLGCTYTGCCRSRARPKASAVSPGLSTSPAMRSCPLRSVGAAWLARMRRRSSIQVMACSSGYWLIRISARLTKSTRAKSWLDRSRAMRMICSWRSSKRKRTRWCAYSTSRRRASCSRSTSSARRYQNAATMAARNISTAASGARAANRSCRVGDSPRHQLRHQRIGAATDGAVGGGGMVSFRKVWGAQRAALPQPPMQAVHILLQYEIIKHYLKSGKDMRNLPPDNGCHIQGDKACQLSPAPRPETAPPTTGKGRALRPRSARIRRVGGCSFRVYRPSRCRARPFPARATHRAGAPKQHRHAVFSQHRLREHHRAEQGSALPRQHTDRKAPARLHALERDGHGGARQTHGPGRWRRPGRPHRLVRLGGQHVWRRFQSFLACRERAPRRGSALYPGP